MNTAKQKVGWIIAIAGGLTIAMSLLLSAPGWSDRRSVMANIAEADVKLLSREWVWPITEEVPNPHFDPSQQPEDGMLCFSGMKRGEPHSKGDMVYDTSLKGVRANTRTVRRVLKPGYYGGVNLSVPLKWLLIIGVVMIGGGCATQILLAPARQNPANRDEM